MMDVFDTLTDDKGRRDQDPAQSWKSRMEQQATASPRPDGLEW